MPDINTLTIPVRIRAVHAHTLTVSPDDNAQDCPKCARGEGCGARPWFRGLFKNRAVLQLPRDHHPWQTDAPAVLHLPAPILTRLTALTYGVPLLIFLLTLALTQSLPPAAQLILSLIGAAVGHLPAHRYSEHLLMRHLRLTPANPEPPARYPAKPPPQT